MVSALIAGLSGEDLTADERQFYRDVQPAGTIIFARNARDGARLKRLVADIRDAVGRDDFLVLIDQEGGRVQRLKPPIARELPPAAAFSGLYADDPEAARRAAFAIARFAAEELSGFGVNMNCAPVLDLPVAGAHDIIGDRAYGWDVAQIVALAERVAAGLMAGGVAPVIKHIPGHGRATADSHLDLPIVATAHDELSVTDFAPFRALAHLPAAMTAHVVYSAIDAEQPASTSAAVIGGVIRDEIGFGGFLMSDDLSMKALAGPMRARAEAVIAAGCDVALHCNGNLDEMREAAAGVPPLAGIANEQFAAACSATRRCEAYDRDDALALLSDVLGSRAKTLLV